MSKQEVIDTTNGDYMVTTGEKLKAVLRNRIGTYQDQHKNILTRMTNELPSKEDAVQLMIALAVDDESVSDRTLFFKAAIERASWLDKEIRYLKTIMHTYTDAALYRVSNADLARFGV